MLGAMKRIAPAWSPRRRMPTTNFCGIVFLNSASNRILRGRGCDAAPPPDLQGRTELLVPGNQEHTGLTRTRKKTGTH